MQVSVASHQDTTVLANIQEVLMGKWLHSRVDVNSRWSRFQQAIKGDSSELAYAFMRDAKGQIVLVASLYAEYKLTRGLCTCYHLEIEYSICSKEDELLFQREVVSMLPAYKITGLNVVESDIFKPNQILMDLHFHKDNQKGKL